MSGGDRAASQAPEVGLLARLLGPFHVTGVFWYRFHGWGVRVLPAWMLAFFIHVFTAGFFVVLLRIRRAVASNLEAVLGPCGWWERQRRIHRTLHTFAWCLTERYEWLNATNRPEAKVENPEPWDRLLAGGKGFLLVTAHIGNWELGPSIGTAHGGRVVHVVREEEIDPRAQEFLRRMLDRQSAGAYRIHFEAGNPQLGLLLLDALRQDEIVALQGDRPRKGGKTIQVSLFGRPFHVPLGPFALARSARAPMLPVFMFRAGRMDYAIHLAEPIEVPASADRQGDFQRAATQLVQSLEWAIRREPHQWFCFRPLWSDGR